MLAEAKAVNTRRSQTRTHTYTQHVQAVRHIRSHISLQRHIADAPRRTHTHMPRIYTAVAQTACLFDLIALYVFPLCFVASVA